MKEALKPILTNLIQFLYLQIMNTHFAKLEQFHKSIRKQQLQSIISQKRILLLEQINPPPMDEELDYHNLNLNSLSKLSSICTTQRGIEETYYLHIEQHLEKFLTKEYLHTQEQRLATLILCNLYMMERPCPPSYEFTKNIVFLIKNASIQTVSNCVTMVFNIASDHKQWKQNLVSQHDICTILCNYIMNGNLKRQHVISILKTSLILIQGHNYQHQSFKEYFPIFVSILGNSASNDNEIIAHTYFSFYHLTLKMPSDATSYVINDKLLDRFLKIGLWLNQNKFLIATLSIIEVVIYQLSQIEIKEKVIPFLCKVIANSKFFAVRQVKNRVIEVSIRSLQQQKITATYLMQHELGKKLQDLFGEEENAETLHNLVQLFSIVIINIDFSFLTLDLERLFIRVENICPSEIETIGYIKQTQYKARMRAQLYNI